MGGYDFAGWLRDVDKRLEAPVKSWVVQLPADRRRRRFNLLFLDDQQTPVAFAKFTANRPNSLAIAALSTFSRAAPDAFWVPTLVVEGRLEDLSFVVTSTAPNLPHRPANLTPNRRRLIVSEIQQRLKDLANPPSVVVHGDFGPWNVRELSTGEIAVFDWEETTVGVTAADELWHVVCLEVRRKPFERALAQVRSQLGHHLDKDVGLAAAFWLDRLNRPESDEIDHSISRPVKLDAAANRIRMVLGALCELTV